MIPAVLASQMQRGVEEFLLTTFPITNPFFERILDRFLGTPKALFRGPFLSLKLPFLPGAEDENPMPEVIPASFRPHLHQQQAFARLDTRVGRSTVVATGTGSGKTECYLYPILHHCHRERGRRGIKAILVYPMNALATDQAGRLARLIWENPELHGHVNAGLYLGDQPESISPVMTETQLITDREMLRQAPPDILLTNYKMLDYLLLRPRDATLWRKNEPETLRYLVVDELHTFDGAQGADLACLIRRLKARLKTPPGQLICVGTSATLGTGSSEQLARYARKLFAEDFDDESVIGESLQSTQQFLQGHFLVHFERPQPEDLEALDPLNYDQVEDYLRVQSRLWLGRAATIDPIALGTALKEHVALRNLLESLGGKARPLAEILEDLQRWILKAEGGNPRFLPLVLNSFLALVSHARVAGTSQPQPLLQVRLQLWLRELRRMVAKVKESPELAFADDLKPDDLKHSMAPIHCRECGLTGWAGTARDADTRINPDLQTFYNSFFSNSQYVRFLFPEARDERAKQQNFPESLCLECLTVQPAASEKHCSGCGAQPEKLLPVWMPDMGKTVNPKGGQTRREGSHDCPSCGGHNSLTILGSRAASLMSVVIAQLFSSPFNEDKKLLAFSDSVQDASHRAGFFAARTYTFNLRGAIQKALLAAGRDVPLPDFPQVFLNHWRGELDEPTLLATFLAPDMDWLEDYAYLREHGRLPENSNLPELVERRLRWEIWSEYTFDCRIGRTLEKTGASTLSLETKLAERTAATLAMRLREEIGLLREATDEDVSRFFFGLVQNLKNRGGVWQPDITGYLESKGNYWQLGKQNGKQPWRPNVTRASRAPAFLINRPADRFLTVVKPPGKSTPTWFEDWMEKSFYRVDPLVGREAEAIYQTVIRVLLECGVFFERPTSNPSVKVWGLRDDAFLVTPGAVQLRCRNCHFAISTSADEAPSLDVGRCLRFRCDGTMERVADTDDYYRKLYERGDVKRIFPAEHTGLLERDTRERVEKGFRSNEIPGDPNLLSCTPTLEMGINIGDLSTLALCSVPPKSANYVQRVGRAGRTDGNSFVMTVANAKPHDLFFYLEPEEMIQGSVETPGCLLDASAVLERQFTAFVFDCWVQSGIPDSELPTELREVLDLVEAGNRSRGFPANMLAYFDLHRTALEDGFLALFHEEMADYTRVRIREFARDEEVDGRLGMVRAIWNGLEQLANERKALRSRIRQLTNKIREVKQDVARDQNYTEVLDELIRERSALNKLVSTINDRHVLNFLTDEGLLPNYAFPEAGVVLRSVIYRKNEKASEDDKRYITYEFSYERPASSAILELAPANHFYAEGRRLEIDQIDLNLSQIEPWRFCPQCSYLEREGRTEPRSACPKCGNSLWTDEGQRRNMLRMKQVISTQSEQQSRSYDESEDREPRFYQKNMFVVKDDGEITDAYFIDKEEVPFGFEFFRKITLREVNFGEQAVMGHQFSVAGKTYIDRPFEICAACGKVRKNGKIEHAIQCRYWRNEENERTVAACFLYREFTSEAIRILLPVADFELERNLQSFIAALDLGLRLKFEGDPGHLYTTTMDEPVTGSAIRKQYLVLYDGVPGGTGYLKELMREEQSLLEVFELAYRHLQECRCRQAPDKDGCYRCLLAYRGRHHQLNTSRRAAMELLKRILGNREHLKRTDNLNRIRINRLLESELEGRFIEVLRRTAEGGPQRTLTNHVVNGKEGFYLRCGSNGWLIEPQVELGPTQGVAVSCRADFVFYPERPSAGDLPIAVFTDGYEYHADSESGLRTDIDSAQRLALVRSGRYRVWSLNWDDVVRDAQGGAATSRAMFPPGSKYRAMVELLAPEQRPIADLWVQATSLQALISYLGEGRMWDWEMLVCSYLLSLPSASASSASITFEKQYESGTELLLSLQGSLPVERLQARDFSDFQGHLILHDDNAHSATREHWKAAWREFLRLSNLLQFLRAMSCTTQLGEVRDRYATIPQERGLPASAQPVPSDTDAMLEFVHPDLRQLCIELARLGVPPPEAGFELAAPNDMIVATAELAWPAFRLALLLPEDAAHSAAFEAAGWRVLIAGDSADLQTTILAALVPEVTE